MAKYLYGWHQERLPSLRYPQLTLGSYPSLPPSLSLVSTGFLPPIWDQGQTNSCTGHGGTRGAMFQRAKQGEPFIDMSRLFPYWNARASEGVTDDNGATIGDLVAALQKFGNCPYEDLPTDPGLTTTPPSPKSFQDAVSHKALGATRVLGANGVSLEYHVKHCLNAIGPVIIGIAVYDSFESDAVASSGNVPLPGPNETLLGGHCVDIVEYDDPSRLFLCDNSWGPSWGKSGRFTIPYAYVLNPGLASDFHAITLES